MFHVLRRVLYLTPVFQLGGKSPVVIDPKCDLKTAANRIMWGKCTNAGQTCVSPDYILVQEDVQDAVVRALKEASVPHLSSQVLIPILLKPRSVLPYWPVNSKRFWSHRQPRSLPAYQRSVR